MTNSIDLFYVNVDNESLYGDRILHMIDELLLKYGKSCWEISYTFCDDEYIRGLNRDHREKDEPTDVLTFSLLEDHSFPEIPGEEIPVPAGDVVISLDTVKSRSSEWGEDFNGELKRVIVHGALHLLGYDHPVDDFNFKSEMLSRQEMLLKEWQNTEVIKIHGDT